MTDKSKAVKVNEPSQDIPIFLRKTYHMIDSCDPAIACWSEDGETFVVKDPVKFERTIIPQFFKHSKFSSFVRQLNFYAFRKIKYADTLRIDPKLEAETANYWRFRHDKFQKGKPELLSEIKRMNGQKSTKGSGSNNSADKKQDPEALKSELNTLKKRIEDMSKNMEELTSLVQKVSLKQEQDTPTVEVGTKRKKFEPALPDPYVASVRPDEMISSMDLDGDFDIPTIPGTAIPAMPTPELPVREPTDTTNLSDIDFVDRLFTVFSEDDPEDIHVEPEIILSTPAQTLLEIPEETSIEVEPSQTISAPSDASHAVSESESSKSKPDPELMSRLSEALGVLPHNMQHLIVDRLVAAIMNSDSLEKTFGAASSLTTTATPPSELVTSGKALPSQIAPLSMSDDNKDGKITPEVVIGMPLAAATLAALLSHYSSQVKAQNVQKTIPVIPAH